MTTLMAGDESKKLAETIRDVRESAGAFIDSWPDRMSPEAVRRKAAQLRRRRSARPKERAPVPELKKEVA